MEMPPNGLQSKLEQLLTPSQVVSGERLAARSPEYCAEAYGAGIHLLPETVQDVSRICEWASAHDVPLVPHGGLTGLVDATASALGDVALSFEKLNRILEIDAAQGIAVVESGVVLQDLIEACDAFGLMPSIDIPSRGSCTIGGLISTNTGGVRVIKYGMTRDNVPGIEAVLADGRVFNAMNQLVKNNAGFDLKHVFIGSEGTLGLVTKAVVKLVPKPMSTAVDMVACAGFDQAVSLLEHSRQTFDSQLMSFEVMWPDYYALTTSQPGFGPPPLATGHPIYVVIETGSWNGDPAQDTLEVFLAEEFETGNVIDAVLAQSETQRQAIWRAREDSDAVETLNDAYLGYDVGLTLSDMPRYVRRLKEDMELSLPGYRPFIFGHMGDGNLHVMIAVSGEQAQQRDQVDQIIYGALEGLGSTTVSAEHGIGLEKRAFLGLSRDQAYVGLMGEFKALLDPNDILNPGKVLAGFGTPPSHSPIKETPNDYQTT